MSSLSCARSRRLPLLQLLPALLTLENGLASNKTGCPKLRASGELPATSTTSNSGEIQFRGEGETVRELPVSNRAGQEILINTMSVARSRASAKQESSKSKCKSNEPNRVTSQTHQQVSVRMHRAKVAQSCAAPKGANPPKRKVSEQSKDAACEQQNAPRKCSNEDVATKKQVHSRYAREDPFLSPQTHVARQASAC